MSSRFLLSVFLLCVPLAAQSESSKLLSPSAATKLSLAWLGSNQADDGSFCGDVEVTALALLAFLREGSTMRSGRYKSQVKRGVKWLREQQQASGRFGADTSTRRSHAIAGCAMIEAYGLSKYILIKKNAQRSTNIVEGWFNKSGWQAKGSAYKPAAAGWCLQLIRSAHDFKLQVGSSSVGRLAILDARLEFTLPNPKAKTAPLEAATALMARGLEGQRPDETMAMQQAISAIRVHRVEGPLPLDYAYFTAHACFQMGGAHWGYWQKKMQPSILAAQVLTGDYAGSFAPADGSKAALERARATAMRTLTLQADLRFVSTVR